MRSALSCRLGVAIRRGHDDRRTWPGIRMTRSLSLGIDIGGTFTDLVAFDPDSGRAFIWKESTTPDDPARGAVEGTRHLLRQHAHRSVAHRPRGACHHAVHQRADRAQGRAHRLAHHRRVPRHAGDRARAEIRAVRPVHRNAAAAGAAPVAARGGGAAGARRLGGNRARRSSGAARSRSAGGGGRREPGDRVPARLRQPGA